MNAFCLAVLMVGGLFAPSQAQPSARDKRKELREVQRQLEHKKREISEYSKEAESLKSDLSKLASETSQSRRKIRVLEDKIRLAQERKEMIQTRLGALHMAQTQWQGALANEIGVYFRQELSRCAYSGSKELWRESFRRAAILEKLRYVSELHGTQRATEAAAVEAGRQKVQLKVKSEQAKAEHQDRETQYRRRKEVYDEAQQKISQTQKAIKELQDSALALTHLVRALESKSPYKAKGGAIPLAEPPHSLPWPAEGRVMSPFGKHQDEKLKVWVINQGIRLATAVDAPVRPVKAGKVIFAGPFRSYGNVVIVDHNQAFFTIYGHLGRLSAKKGDSVRASDALGTAGPAENGGLVYFEMRQSGDALDPLAWLEQR